MPSKGSRELFLLIKSLSKAEKGYFRWFAERRARQEEIIYLDLFDAIEKQEEYDEGRLLNELSGIKKSRLPNLKNYLHQLILHGLREMYAKDSAHNLVKQAVQNAELLYTKTLFNSCKKLVFHTKKKAYAFGFYTQLLDILQIERRLMVAETYPKDMEARSAAILKEELDILERIKIINSYKALSERSFILLKRKGEARTKADFEAYNAIVSDPLFKKDEALLAEEALFHRYFTLANCYYAQGDIEKDYLFRKKIIDLKERNRKQLIENLDHYIGQYNNLLISLLSLKRLDEALKAVARLRKLPARSVYTRAGIFITTSFYELSVYALRGEFEKGQQLLRQIEQELPGYEGKMNKAKEFLLYHNCAWICFGTGSYNEALDWLNRILNDSSLHLRQDIYMMARIMSLIIHFELGNTDYLDYFVKSTYRFLYSQQRLFTFEATLLDFIRKNASPNISRRELVEGFRELKEHMLTITQDPFERKALDYFDLIAWLDSKIQNQSMSVIIRQKAKEKGYLR